MTESAERACLNLSLVRERMAALGLNAAELARRCRVSRMTVSGWLAGTYQPRPAKQLRLSLTLKLGLRELMGLQEEAARVVQVLVGQDGRAPAELKSRLDDTGHSLLTLAPLLGTSPFVRAVDSKPSLADGHLDLVAGALRAQLGRCPAQRLVASDLLALLRGLDVQVTPSLWGQDECDMWTVVTWLPRDGDRLVVHLPTHATSQQRLTGLAQALGVCLSLHALTPENARRYGRKLATRLLSENSVDDLAERLVLSSPTAFVASARRTEMGAVMDAVEQFQTSEGGRNHAFVSRALHVALLDAYELSADLYPGLRERLARTQE